MRLVRHLLASVALGIAAPALAAEPEHICDLVAERVSAETGVPLPVMRAITRVETGRKRDGALRPWPWTVNMEGEGRWFDTRQEAETYVARHFARGARSFDVGCFQINYKWHGKAFASVSEMFDPFANARYAAQFLAELHAEFGDWSKVAGAYHSRTPKFANAYAKKFARVIAALPSADIVPPVIPPVIRRASVERINRFPLLRGGGGSQSASSLVHLDDAGLSPLLVSRTSPLIAFK